MTSKEKCEFKKIFSINIIYAVIIILILVVASGCKIQGSEVKNTRISSAPIIKTELFDGINSHWGDRLELVQSDLGVMQVPGLGPQGHKGTELNGEMKNKNFAGIPFGKIRALFVDDRLYKVSLDLIEKKYTAPPSYREIKDAEKWRTAKTLYDKEAVIKEKARKEKEDKIVSALMKAYGEPIRKTVYKKSANKRFEWEDDDTVIKLSCRGDVTLDLESKQIGKELLKEQEYRYRYSQKKQNKYVPREKKKILLADGTFLKGLTLNCNMEELKSIFPDVEELPGGNYVERPNLEFHGMPVTDVHFDMLPDLFGVTIYAPHNLNAEKARIIIQRTYKNLVAILGKPLITMPIGTNDSRTTYQWVKDDIKITLSCYGILLDAPPEDKKFCIYISIRNYTKPHVCP